MQCPRCYTENVDASRFCVSCATPLPGGGRGAEGGVFSDGPPSPGSPPSPGGFRSPGTPYDFPAHTSATGRLVGGKYEIAEEIGRGGMGVVYKARDIRLERWVALKFLPSSLADSAELRERFLVEARAAAALAHPNICVIHEVGEDEGQPFMAMEYVEGETLRQRIKREPLGTEEALALMSQIAAGLEAAHKRGIIHRDIKSSNIMVTAQGQAKVMDFGLAKLRGGPELTKTQTTLGTVAYMSPEQAGGGEVVDHRTDLWSAGVVLYEMVTRELPFQGQQDAVIVHAILYGEAKSLRHRTPPVPLELQEVVGRALKKKPRERYGSAEEMLQDLRRYQEALAAEAAGVLNMRSLVRRLRQPRVALAVAAGLVAVAVLGFWYAQHRADVRWAREVALPEIEQIIADNDLWRNLVPAFHLAERAERYIPKDPKLAQLFGQVSLNVNVVTDPPGARVFVKEYATPEAEWAYLGVTPLERVRMPIGVFRWKLEKEGYETVLAAASTWNHGDAVGGRPGTVVPYDLVRTLDPVGTVPPGMVRVPATQTEIGALEDFFVGRCEVTNREYKAFVDAGGYRNREYWKHPFMEEGRELAWEEAIVRLVDQAGLPGPSTWMAGDYPPRQADHPVSGVSWYEAAAYAEYNGMSLPTRFHWVTAAGRFTPMIRTPQLGGYAILAPFNNFGGQGPVPVGSLQGITPYGAYDMAGNVREWCWNETPQGRLLRGGAWDDNSYMFLNWSQAPPMDRSARNGFRVAHYPLLEAVPPGAFRFEGLNDPIDHRTERPVTDPVFEVYREQFDYDATDLNARVENREESPGGWVLEKVSFDAAYGGEQVVAYLFLPRDAAPPYQPVIYFPADPSVRERSIEDMGLYWEFQVFLSFLVKSGRAVVFPVVKGTFERGNEALSTIYFGERNSRPYTELFFQQARDFRRAIDYLETRPDIASEKLAFYGMCSSAALGAILPAVEERLRVSVLVAGGFSQLPFRPEASQINYVTRVKIPTLMLNGRYDGIFPRQTASEPMFDLLGTPPEHKRQIFYETDHIPPRAEYVKETLAWLDRYLGPVNR